MEPVEQTHITRVKFTPDVDHDMVILEAEFSGCPSDMYLEATGNRSAVTVIW